MSAIAGIYNLDGRPVDAELLGRMLECVPHRGPDGARIWTDGFVGLGHRQLCTTEESLREVQPAKNRDGTCRITFDGRVDNREELIDRLRAHTGRLEEPTDVDLVLCAYDAWGPDCLRWIVGDFAFALWDARRQRLFCARDTYGVRPFYFSCGRGRFLFGSECSQIFQDEEIPLAVHDGKVAEWFTRCGLQGHAYRDLRRSFFRGISELPHAHYCIVDSSGTRVFRYWDAVPRREIRYRRVRDYFEHFALLFREAVRCRMRSHRPLGAELSGGFDSSSIVCMAAEIGRSDLAARDLYTYSMVFDELACDERPLIESVLQKYPARAHFVVSDQLCGLHDFPPGLEPATPTTIDYPDQAFTQKALEALYRLAESHGVRAMLSGEGAEHHVLGHSEVYDSLLRGLEWKELWARLRELANRSSWLSASKCLIARGVVPLFPGGFNRRLYLTWVRRGLKQGLPDWLTPLFASRVFSEIERQKQFLIGFPVLPDWGRQLQYETLCPSSAVFGPLARAAVERRFPYVDRRVVEFCMAIPPELKDQRIDGVYRRSVRGRRLQREALSAVLPEAIAQLRHKVNFNDLHRKRFVAFEDAYAEMFAPPAEPLVARNGYIDAERFWEVTSYAIRQAKSSGEPPSLLALWINRTVLVELWLRALCWFDRERQGRIATSRSEQASSLATPFSRDGSRSEPRLAAP